jgi:DNA primase
MIEKLLEHYGADMHRVSDRGWRSIKCPFHDDKHASARVNLDKDAFACLACGVKGDTISLIKEREGLDYHAAVRYAEEISGQVVPGVRRTAQDERKRPKSQWRDRLFESA